MFASRRQPTNQAGVAVIFCNCNCNCNCREIAILNEMLCCLLHSLYANAETVLRLGQDHFAPNSFQFIIHQSSYRSDGVVNQITRPRIKNCGKVSKFSRQNRVPGELKKLILHTHTHTHTHIYIYI
jgi:hypothetical protein